MRFKDSIPTIFLSRTVSTSIKEGKFTGWVDSGDIPDGEGTWTSDDGDVFVGKFTRGKRDGQGKLASSDGTVIYEGAWKDGAPAK